MKPKRSAILYACLSAGLVFFAGGSSYAQGFGVNVVNGVEAYAGNGSKVFAKPDFLSSQTLCGRWREKQGEIEQALVTASGTVNSSLPSGVSIVRQSFSISQNCTGVANYAAGTMVININLPDNVFTFNVTTPGPLPQSWDPRVSLHFALRASTQAKIPTNPRNGLAVEPAKVTIFNVEPKGENITGDIALAAAKLASQITGQDFVGKLTRDRTFEFNSVSSTVDSLNNVLKAVAVGTPFQQTYEPTAKLVILRAPRREVSFRSLNFPDRYIRHRNMLGFLEPVSYRDFLGQKDATFIVVPGLAGRCSSFESYNFPGQFLRHQGSRLKLAPRGNDQLFRDDATFCVVKGLAGSGSSFESVNYPGQFIRHRNFELWLARNDGTDLFTKDATFETMPPLVVQGSVVR